MTKIRHYIEYSKLISIINIYYYALRKQYTIKTAVFSLFPSKKTAVYYCA